MDEFGYELNRLLVDTYRSAGKIEEIMLRDLSAGQLSIAEMHAIECVGRARQEGRTIKDIARELDITPPSATAMIQRLERRGFVIKERSVEDGRQVRIRLTDHGMRAYIGYRYFHRKMVNAVRRDIEPQEMEVLLRAVRGINEFFRQKLFELENGETVKPDRRAPSDAPAEDEEE